MDVPSLTLISATEPWSHKIYRSPVLLRSLLLESECTLVLESVCAHCYVWTAASGFQTLLTLLFLIKFKGGDGFGHLRIMLEEARRGRHVPWSGTYRQLRAAQHGCWDLNSGPLEAQYAFVCLFVCFVLFFVFSRQGFSV